MTDEQHLDSLLDKKNTKITEDLDCVNGIKVGDRFGRLEAIAFGTSDGTTVCILKCDCGCFSIREPYHTSSWKAHSKECAAEAKYMEIARQNSFRFNNLLVRSVKKRDIDDQWCYECTCACGLSNELIIREARKIINGEYKSCGICREFNAFKKAENRSQGQETDYVGKMFGPLKVISKIVQAERKPHPYFECVCVKCSTHHPSLRSTSIRKYEDKEFCSSSACRQQQKAAEALGKGGK